MLHLTPQSSDSTPGSKLQNHRRGAVLIWTCPTGAHSCVWGSLECFFVKKFLQYSEVTKTPHKPSKTPQKPHQNPHSRLLCLSQIMVQTSPCISNFSTVSSRFLTFLLSGLKNFFTFVDREEMKIRGFDSLSACLLRWLFLSRTMNSQSFISLYRWLFVLRTNPELIPPFVMEWWLFAASTGSTWQQKISWN